MKRLIKKSYFWVSVMIIILAIVLLYLYSGKIVNYTEYYTYQDQSIEFDPSNDIVTLKAKNGAIVKYTYRIDGYEIHIYNMSTGEEVDVLKIKDKFNIESKYGTVYTADVAFLCTALSGGGVLLILDVLFIRDEIQKIKKLKNQNQN